MIRFGFYMIGLVMLFFASSMTCHSKDYKLNVVQESIADPCDIVYDGDDYTKSRRVLLSIEIDSVEIADSLFGFTLYMQYDDEKWYFMNSATMNTLSETFDEGQIKSAGQGEGHLWGSLGSISNFDNPAYGNKPLVKLQFAYMGDCPDTSMIVIKELSFTSECKIPYFKYDTTYIYADVQEDDNKYAKVEFDSIDKIFGEEYTKSGFMTLDLPRIAKIETFKVELDKSSNFHFANFAVEGGLAINSIDETDNSIILDMAKTSESEDYIISYDINRIADEDFNDKVRAAITSLNDCNCALEIFDAEQNIAYTKTSITEIREQQLFVKDNSGIKLLTQENLVEIYDLNGNCSKYQNADMISFDDRETGLYFIVIKALNKIEKIKYLNIK